MAMVDVISSSLQAGLRLKMTSMTASYLQLGQS